MKQHLLNITILLVLFLLNGCQVTTPSATSPTPPSEASADPRIEILLDQATVAFAEDRLTTPVDDNAYLLYVTVLSIDPENEIAHQGISNIVERYLAWAIDNVYRGHYRAARDYLTRAKSVDERHPNIGAVENLIRSHQQRQVETYPLDSALVSQRSPALSAELQRISKRINTKNAEILIEARSDANGRWIYQQLNQHFETRIRARFELTNRTRIELRY